MLIYLFVPLQVLISNGSRLIKTRWCKHYVVLDCLEYVMESNWFWSTDIAYALNRYKGTFKDSSLKKIILAILLLFVASGLKSSEPAFATNLFEKAVACIKKFEGWHSEENYPYIGYGHKLQSDEEYDCVITESFADSLLRADLLQKCAVFREFGRDSLLLAVLAYNIGEYRILGRGELPRSKLIQKLEKGDRDIYDEYITFRKYNGKIVKSLEERRKYEFDLLFHEDSE